MFQVWADGNEHKGGGGGVSPRTNQVYMDAAGTPPPPSSPAAAPPNALTHIIASASASPHGPEELLAKCKQHFYTHIWKHNLHINSPLMVLHTTRMDPREQSATPGHTAGSMLNTLLRRCFDSSHVSFLRWRQPGGEGSHAAA